MKPRISRQQAQRLTSAAEELCDPQVDLDELAEWIKTDTHFPSTYGVRPADLQRTPWSLTFNAACSALEALEARGDLDRIDSTRLHWRPARKPDICRACSRPTAQGDTLCATCRDAKGHQITLSDQEREALLNLLAERFDVARRWTATDPEKKAELKALRAIRDRLRRNT